MLERGKVQTCGVGMEMQPLRTYCALRGGAAWEECSGKRRLRTEDISVPVSESLQFIWG